MGLKCVLNLIDCNLVAPISRLRLCPDHPDVTLEERSCLGIVNILANFMLVTNPATNASYETEQSQTQNIQNN